MLPRRVLALFALLIAAGVLAGCDDAESSGRAQRRADRPATAPATAPAGHPATAPSSRPAEPPRPLERYTDLLLKNDPDFPTTQPMPSPVTLEEAARLVFEEPVFLDAVGCLWLVHERGRSPETILAGDLRKQTYVISEPVVFTWWKPGHDGKPTVEMILGREDGGFDWLHEMGRAPVPVLPDGREYDWSRAFVYDRSIVVPTTGGTAVLTPVDRPDPAEALRRSRSVRGEGAAEGGGGVQIRHIALAEVREALPETQIRHDGRGLIAWVPWMSRRRAGSDFIGRYIEGEWTELSGGDWADRPVHLMPLSDGSILQLSMDERGDSKLTAVPLNAISVEREVIEKLVKDLLSTDSKVREAAFVALAGYGPGAWPILEELHSAQPMVVQKQLNILLGDKRNPTFGGLMPEPGGVEVREWLADGGVILRFANGILLPDGAGVTVLERPAWLLVRPGRRIGLLDPMLVSELSSSEKARLFVWGDEWIVCAPDQGAKRWLVNHLEPVLEEKHAQWQHFAGIDQVGRWLFRRTKEDAQTLLVDVRIADPAPRLPMWVIESGVLGEAGYDEEGWPVSKAGGAWRLIEQEWLTLAEDEPFTAVDADVPQEVLARGPDGTVYRGGIDEIEASSPDGKKLTWKLPPEAAGSGTAKAVVDNEGRLFLFNRPGRVVRIARSPDEAQPFEVEAIFEEAALPGASPQHVWLDPAGRICAIYFGNTVVVMWPDGKVPPSIRQKMPAKLHQRPPEDPFRRV